MLTEPSAAPSTTPGHRRALRDAQRAWIAFRDAELASMFYVPPGRDARQEYGSMHPMERCAEARVLTEAHDVDVWAHARAGGLTLVSKDSGFVDLAIVRGIPPCVVWIQAGNQPTARGEALA